MIEFLLERMVRINAFGSGFEEDDLSALRDVFSNGFLDAVSIPKVECPQHLERMAT